MTRLWSGRCSADSRLIVHPKARWFPALDRDAGEATHIAGQASAHMTDRQSPRQQDDGSLGQDLDLDPVSQGGFLRVHGFAGRQLRHRKDVGADHLPSAAEPQIRLLCRRWCATHRLRSAPPTIRSRPPLIAAACVHCRATSMQPCACVLDVRRVQCLALGLPEREPEPEPEPVSLWHK